MLHIGHLLLYWALQVRNLGSGREKNILLHAVCDLVCLLEPCNTSHDSSTSPLSHNQLICHVVFPQTVWGKKALLLCQGGKLVINKEKYVIDYSNLIQDENKNIIATGACIQHNMDEIDSDQLKIFSFPNW